MLHTDAPCLTIQQILGHQHIDTTLGYARLYDGKVAADYYRAMAQVEARLELGEGSVNPAPDPGQRRNGACFYGPTPAIARAGALYR